MTALKNLSRQSAPAFELKARMMTLSILRVLSADIANLFRQLDAKIATAPDLFQNFPILLDFEDLPEDAQRGFDELILSGVFVGTHGGTFLSFSRV